MITLRLPGPPLSWKAPYVGTRGAFSVRTPVKRQLQELVREHYKGELIDEAVIVDIAFYFTVPKSTSAKKRMLMINGDIKHIKRPDISNLEKFLHDVLIGTVLSDDSMIVESRGRKLYGEQSFVQIEVTPCS